MENQIRCSNCRAFHLDQKHVSLTPGDNQEEECRVNPPVITACGATRFPTVHGFQKCLKFVPTLELQTEIWRREREENAQWLAELNKKANGNHKLFSERMGIPPKRGQNSCLSAFTETKG